MEPDPPGERVTLLELPEAADEQRAQMVANLQAKSDRYDVLGLDVVWTAEFADAGWIIPLERGMFPLDRFLPPVVDTAVYRGKLWAVPYTSNAGLLYYRKDLLAKQGSSRPRPGRSCASRPRALHEKYDIGGYAGQFLAYEGLTVNFAEAVQSAGRADPQPGRHEGDHGLGQGQGRPGLPGRAGSAKAGSRAESLTFKEEESRLAFQEGRLAFARNWPHAYGPATGSAVGGQVRGHPAARARRSGLQLAGRRQPRASAPTPRSRSRRSEFIRYFTGLENQRRVLTDGSFPPVWAELYDDPDLIKRFPYLPVLKQSILSAQPRPASANYNQVSLVIASAVSNALTPPFQESADDIVASMKAELNEIIRAQ